MFNKPVERLVLDPTMKDGNGSILMVGLTIRESSNLVKIIALKRINKLNCNGLHFHHIHNPTTNQHPADWPLVNIYIGLSII
jgi:hypothetical protein